MDYACMPCVGAYMKTLRVQKLCYSRNTSYGRVGYDPLDEVVSLINVSVEEHIEDTLTHKMPRLRWQLYGGMHRDFNA